MARGKDQQAGIDYEKVCPFCRCPKDQPAWIGDPEAYPEEVLEGWIALDGYCADAFHQDEEE